MPLPGPRRGPGGRPADRRRSFVDAMAGARFACLQTLEGSFSAVSKPNFASKYAFESSRRDLHNALLCSAPKSHFFLKHARFCQILRNFAKFWKKLGKNSAIFNENFEIRERCKGVHCVDLGESFPTSIYLQKSASIQPRTSSFNFN